MLWVSRDQKRGNGKKYIIIDKTIMQEKNNKTEGEKLIYTIDRYSLQSDVQCSEVESPPGTRNLDIKSKSVTNPISV